ncbi:hypothetical protein [Megamonas funiformis]|uniref:hypothetical protein n=1 Tax=Megamonas funiformis TaxID=437897 RepID=UPI002942BF09|nr:hypothetical protein [Megamonas funiformis]
MICVFRKKVKIIIKNNNDNNVKKYMVFAIKYCAKRGNFLGVKKLREIVEDVYLNNYCMFNALAISLFIACCGLMLNTIANKNTIGLIFIMFMMCILIVLKIELDYIIKKKILLKIDKEIK